MLLAVSDGATQTDTPAAGQADMRGLVEMVGALLVRLLLFFLPLLPIFIPLGPTRWSLQMIANIFATAVGIWIWVVILL